MSFYREMEVGRVDAEIATLNERLMIFQACGRPTTLREKNGCNYHNVTIIYSHFRGQLYIYNCFNHANYSYFNIEL